MTLIYTPDALRQKVESTTNGKVTVLYDAKGFPSYMCVIPKFNIQDVEPLMGTGVHPAFLVNGVEKSQIFIGQFPASNQGGTPVSLPGAIPWVSINYDNAKAACVAKGAGWHMMTNWEWAAIMLMSLKNGFEPTGNTNHGRHHRKTFEAGRRVDGGVIGNSSGNGNTLTGSGPSSWSHDNSLEGISDLVGNVWEWIDGFKINEGQIFMPVDNNYSLADTLWPATGCFFDATGSATSGNPRLNGSRVITSTDTSILNPWSEMTRGSGFTPPVAIAQACIDPVGIAKSALGYITVRNHGERIPLRGSSRDDNSKSGFGALHIGNFRSSMSTIIAFRPVFIN